MFDWYLGTVMMNYVSWEL